MCVQLSPAFLIFENCTVFTNVKRLKLSPGKQLGDKGGLHVTENTSRPTASEKAFTKRFCRWMNICPGLWLGILFNLLSGRAGGKVTLGFLLCQHHRRRMEKSGLSVCSRPMGVPLSDMAHRALTNGAHYACWLQPEGINSILVALF